MPATLSQAARSRLAAAAAARVKRLSNRQLTEIIGDQVENIADEIAKGEGVPFNTAFRALNKALRQARLERMDIEPSRSGTPPGLSLVLTPKEKAYVAHKAKEHGSRAAVIHAALDILMKTEP